MKRAFLVFALLMAIISCYSQTNQSAKDFKKLEWLKGSWRGLIAQDFFYEAWRPFNDSVLVNFKIEIKNGDTSIRESGALFLKGKEIIYGNRAVSWKMTRLTENEIVLKNDSLSYSNTIIWLNTGNNHWLTILENPGSTIYYDLEKFPLLDKKIDEFIKAIMEKKSN